jgi:ABC-type lipoprotein export system ATPase subunit
LRDDAAAIRLEGLTRTYPTPTGEVRALTDVSAEMRAGVVTAIVGPSGSGKSSLLRLLAGLDRPDRGRIDVFGKELGTSGRSRRAIRSSTIGYLYQRPSDNLIPHLTLREHLQLAGATDRAEIAEFVDALGIGDRLDHLPVQLSGGEQQRAAVAQVLASGASVIVADEPTAELDSGSAQRVLEGLADIVARGVTVVIATHDPSVMAIATDRIELDHGRLSGTSSEATASPGSNEPLRWGTEPIAPDPFAERDPALELRDVERSFGVGATRVRALIDLQLTVMPGTLVGLVGRSGSGKTTLLNIAAGWDRPDAGTVARPGGDSPTWSDVATVPQHLGLIDELSVRENVEYPLRLLGTLGGAADLVDDLMERLGLSGFQRRLPRETSLGEQQRTAVARAIVARPALLVADEPTAHQDAAWGATVVRTLGETALAGTGCVIATHDRAVLGSVDHALHIEDGRLGPAGSGADERP